MADVALRIMNGMANQISPQAPSNLGLNDPKYKAANKKDIEDTVNDDSLDPTTLVKKAKAALGIGG